MISIKDLDYLIEIVVCVTGVKTYM